MPQKVYIVELDALNGAALKKIEQVQKELLETSARTTAAFNRVNANIERDLNKTSSLFNKFSRRDLGLLSSQLLYSAGSTGKLGGQLSNLATGLATGGVIGAAFAGFAALVNVLTEELKDQTAEVSGLRKEYDEMVKKNQELNEFDTNKLADLEKQRQELKDNIALYEMVDNLREDEKFQLMDYRNQLEKVNKEIKFFAFVWEKAGMFEEEHNKTVKEKVNTYDKLLERLEKYSKFISPRGIDANAMLTGLGAGIDTSKMNVEPLDPFLTKILEKHPGEELTKGLEKAQEPMSALVSLSNQMASNFSFAGHTFVGQLSQAIAMVDSISNMILTIASLFGGGGGYGIGGLLSLIGLEKGGRITNLGGNISYTKIPSFAMGGSYSTPGMSGPFGGGYPVMVHKNETLDVYSSGQTSKMENKMDRLINAVLTSNVHLSKKNGGGSQPIIVMVDGEKLFTVNTKRNNRASRAGVNTGEMI